jgi:hypothetical protein
MRDTVAVFIALGAVMVAGLISIPTQTQAKITPGEDPSCSNNGGNDPGGQQPNCKGGGLDQNPGSPAKNPAGNDPPGQNK